MSSTTEKIVLGSGEMFIMDIAGELPTTEEILKGRKYLLIRGNIYVT